MAPDPDLQPNPRLALAFAESVRNLESQSRTLDELRTRTGVLLAAATISASFLGATALGGRAGGFTFWSACALIVFAWVIAMTMIVLWPTDGWTFTTSAKVMVDSYVDDEKLPQTIDDMHRYLALDNQEYWEENDEKLRNQFSAFRWACLGVGLETMLWIVDLASKG
jgi:hypothetical protein